MPRPQLRQPQLDLPWTAVIRWEDLPVAVRDRVRERLVALLRDAARQAAEAPEARDDDE